MTKDWSCVVMTQVRHHATAGVVAMAVGSHGAVDGLEGVDVEIAGLTVQSTWRLLKQRWRLTHEVLVYNMQLLFAIIVVGISIAAGSFSTRARPHVVGLAVCSQQITLVAESDGTMWFDSLGTRLDRRPIVFDSIDAGSITSLRSIRGIGMAHIAAVGSTARYASVLVVSADSGRTFFVVAFPDSVDIVDVRRSDEPSRWWCVARSGDVWFVGRAEAGARRLEGMARPPGDVVLHLSMATHTLGAAIVHSGMIFTEDGWRTYKRNRLPAGVVPADVQSLDVTQTCAVIAVRDTVYQAPIHVPRWAVHDSLVAARMAVNRVACVATNRDGRVHILDRECRSARPGILAVPLTQQGWEFAPGLVVAWLHDRVVRYTPRGRQ